MGGPVRNQSLACTGARLVTSLLREFFTALVCVGALLTLTACGGGGGGGSTSSGSFTMNTNSLAFKVRSNAGVQTQSVTVTITGSGVAYLGAAYTGGQTQPSWLAISITGSGSSYQMVVNVQPGAVSAGKYSTAFEVGTADSGGNILSHQDFTVTFEVDQGVTIVTAPGTLNFGYDATPLTQQLALNVGADSTQQWTAESDSAWLNVPTSTQTGAGVTTRR